MDTSLPLRAHQVLVDMEEVMNKTVTEEGQKVSLKPKRMHRFPQHLREMGGGPGSRYVVPSVVAIGPYHHGLPHLGEMEQVKHAAAYSFCQETDRSVKEVYGKVLSVANDARSCYTYTTGGAGAGAGASSSSSSPLMPPWLNYDDAEFAAMMFLDGCFLLQLMDNTKKPPFLGLFMSAGPSILKDLFLLENQIPWLVLEALMEFKPMEEQVRGWVFTMVRKYFFERQEKKTALSNAMRFLQNLHMRMRYRRRRLPPLPEEEKKTSSTTSSSNGDNDDPSSSKSKPPPPHLLGLLRSIMACGMPAQKRKSEFTFGSSLSVSAVYLPQIGIRLTASTAGWFADMRVEKKPLFGELSLSPLFLNDIVACYLVNLAALEAAEATAATSVQSDGYVVSSYLSVLAMLMDREEDVHELRAKGLLCSRFSNTQTLAFFKDLGLRLRAGNSSYTIMQEIDEYMQRRPVRILVHKFIYNNHKTIVAFLSLAAVFVSILKALYSINKVDA